MNLGRRQFLGCTVASTAALAGCADMVNNASGDGDGGGNGGNGGEEESDPVVTEQTPYVEEDWIDDSVVVREDYYRSWDWTWEQSWTIEYEFLVREGPPVDVFVTTAEEYEHYEAGERFEYWGDTLDSAGGSDSVTLDSGEYVLVVDNTDLVEAEPPSNFDEDPAEVEISATIREA